MSQNNYRFKVTSFIPWPYTDPTTNEERNGIYIRGAVDTGDELRDELYKAAKFKQGKSSDINMFLFCEKKVNADGVVLVDQFAAFQSLRDRHKFEHINAVTVKVPWTDLPYHRKWTRDANNGAKTGDIVKDSAGIPITYDYIEVTILCSETGEHWEDAVATARRWYTRELKRGNIVPADGIPAAIPTEGGADPNAEFEAALAAFAAEAGIDDITDTVRERFRARFDADKAKQSEQTRTT